MTSAFPSLAAHALEDTMEVSSSPAGNTFDNDIDIDFDDYGGGDDGVHLTDDERMLEDGDPTRPPTATDEMMDDEEHTITVEEVMHDDPPNDQVAQPELADEELIDYEDDDYQDVDHSFLNDTTLQDPETTFAAPTELAAEPEHISEAVINESELLTEEQTNVLEQPVFPADDVTAPAVEASAPEDPQSEPSNVAEVQSQHTAQADQAQELEDVAEGEELQYEPEAAAAEPVQGNDAAATLKQPPQLPGTLNTTSTAVPDGPPTPTDTGLHPMIINYREYSMPMFKSRRQPTGLLKSDNLASVSLSDLIENCRKQLQKKVEFGEVDEAIPADHDVVLGFDHLGLMLVEGNKSTYDTSLNDVFEIWQILHENEGNQDLPPFAVKLTSQSTFSCTFNLLQKAANEGRGLSEVAPHASLAYQPEDEGDLVANDDHAADQGQEYANGDEEHFEEHEGDYGFEYADEDGQYQEGEAELQEGQEIPYEPGEEAQADQNPEGGSQEEANYADFEENEDYPDPEDFDQDQENDNTDDLTAPEDHGGTEDEVKEEKPAETVAPDSAASSTTVRGDTTNDAADTGSDHGEDNFSTFLDEYDGETGVEASEDAQKLRNEAEQTLDVTDPAHETADLQEEQATFDLGSEDLLNTEVNDQATGDEAADNLHGAQDGIDPDDDLIQYEEDTFDEADYVDFTNQDENELGEDDEQFHTAVDLLDGDDTQNGPEHADTTEAGNQPNVVDEDDIGYDDDDFGEPLSAANEKKNSPLGKRSFEEHADNDGLDFEEPEPKKARSD